MRRQSGITLIVNNWTVCSHATSAKIAGVLSTLRVQLDKTKHPVFYLKSHHTRRGRRRETVVGFVRVFDGLLLSCYNASSLEHATEICP